MTVSEAFGVHKSGLLGRRSVSLDRFPANIRGTIVGGGDGIARSQWLTFS
jgi:hypothetical protein